MRIFLLVISILGTEVNLLPYVFFFFWRFTNAVKAAQEREETHVDTGSRAKADADVDTDNEQTALENGM